MLQHVWGDVYVDLRYHKKENISADLIISGL